MPVRVDPHAIIVHFDDRVLVCDVDGKLSRTARHGFFAADTRFVSGYRLKVGGVAPVRRNSAALSAFGARFEYSNDAFNSPLGPVRAETLHLRLDRSVGSGVHEDYDLANYGPEVVELSVEMSIESDFADLFDVKQGRETRRGTLQSQWHHEEQVLSTRYVHDDFVRALHLRVQRPSTPPEFANGAIWFPVILPPGGRWHVCLIWEPEVAGHAPPGGPRGCHVLTPELDRGDEYGREWIRTTARVTTSNPDVDDVVRRAIDDLSGLRLHEHDERSAGPERRRGRWVPAAGVPWFVSLFGRDSLVVTMQTPALSPEFSQGALHALASLQADTYDDDRDMQPGKVMHEIRRGELAHFHLIPHTPYYGSHDATSLFVWAAAAAWYWHGDRPAIDRLRPHVERALAWIDRDGDPDGDGLQEYASRAAAGGYYNQGWKDSPDAIVDHDGTISSLPLALCELQGYVVAAKRSWADVLEEVWGEQRAARRLRDEASQLAERIEEQFWWEDESTYYLGLDGRKQPIRTVASNSGHLLWAGAVVRERAHRVAARLFQDDLWSGWGIRTLSCEHPSYNPFSYHRGSVWPHDNAIIAAGLHEYGLPDLADRVVSALFAAASARDDRRLPELFSGLPRDPGGFPVQYLGANVPQAWASGSVVHALTTMLGLQPNARRGHLRVRPALPAWLPAVSLENLEVGGAAADLHIARRPDGSCQVEAVVRRGQLTVEHDA